MNKQMMLVSLAVLGLLGSAAMAEDTAQKAATRIDFNRIIDENNHNGLQEDMAAKLQAAPAKETPVNTDKRKVLDFVDVEIGLGEERPVVDRRFNSVGAPRLAHIAQDQSVMDEQPGT